MTLEGSMVRSIRVMGPLGKGGMGEVYLGFDEVLKRKVALKTMRIGKRMDETNRRRFLREAQILSSLEHPNICRVYDLVSGDEQDIIVLELVVGSTLRRKWQEGLSTQQKLDLAIQVTDALVAAHSMSVVHRDLKPDNIMVTADLAVKVLDFGLARSITDQPAVDVGSGDPDDAPSTLSGGTVDALTVSEFGRIVGTPRYMSPEQAQGEPVTAASDMFSLGLVLQELFTEKIARKGQGSIVTLLRQAQWGDTEPFVGVQPQLARLIDQLTSYEPRDRPSAVAAADRLRFIAGAPRRRRIRALIAAVWVVLLALSAGLGVQSVRATRAAEQARRETETANRVSDFMVDIFRTSNPWQQGDGSVTAREILERGAEKIEHELVDEPLVKARLMAAIGNTYAALGLYDEAEAGLEAALSSREDLLGADHPDVATTLDDLAWVYGSWGKFEQADELLVRALDIRERVLGLDHLDVAQSLSSLADLRSLARSDLAEAEALYRRSLEIRERSLGTDHPDVANSIIHLGMLLRRLGDYDGAEALLTRGLGILEKEFGSEHPAVAEALNTLAILYRDKGDSRRAIELHSEVLEISESVYGPDHSIVAESLNNLAVCYAAQGRHAEAEPLLKRTLEIREAVFGPDHPAVAETLYNLGGHNLRLERLSEAERLFRRALEIRENAYGPDHPKVSSSLSGVGVALGQQHRWEEAEAVYRRALEIDERTYGKEHVRVSNHLLQLAAINAELGNHELSESLHRRSLDLPGKEPRPRAPDGGVSLRSLARLLIRMERHAEARDACSRGIAIAESLVVQDPDDISSRSRMGDLLTMMGSSYEATGETAAARAAWSRAVEVFEPIADRYTATAAIHTHARALIKLGRHDEARPIVERLVAEGRARDSLLELCKEESLELGEGG